MSLSSEEKRRHDGPFREGDAYGECWIKHIAASGTRAEAKARSGHRGRGRKQGRGPHNREIARLEPQAPLKPTKTMRVIWHRNTGEHLMKKAAVILASIAAIGATVVSVPADARGWRHGYGWGPGPAIGFGLAAGALAAGAVGAYGPYYGPGYYGGPRYYGYGPRYRPAYYGGYYGPGYGYGYGGPRYYRSYGYW
jgi:hypothetical protein